MHHLLLSVRVPAGIGRGCGLRATLGLLVTHGSVVADGVGEVGVVEGCLVGGIFVSRLEHLILEDLLVVGSGGDASALNRTIYELKGIY